MQFDRMKRREFVALLGGAVARGTITVARWRPRAVQQPGWIRPAHHAGAPGPRGQASRRHRRSAALRRGESLRDRRRAGAGAQHALARGDAHDGSAQGRADDGLRHHRTAGRGDSSPATAMSDICRPARCARRGPAATHKVTALRTFVFPGPSIRLPPTETLSFGSQLAIARIDGAVCDHRRRRSCVGSPSRARDDEGDRFRRGRGAVRREHPICGAARPASASTARDCCSWRSTPAASLVRATPTCRSRRWGSALARPHELKQLRRGDLVFWKGHVAIVRDDATVVHANASRHMAVAFEPIAEAIPRIRAIAGEVTSVRRLTPA